jgi:tetratricopeptide (TPR) repeat protein
MGEHGDSRDLGRLRLAMAQLMLLAQPPRAEQALQMLESTREALLDLGSQGERAIWSTTVAGALLLIGDPEGAVEQCDRALRSLDILETRDAAAALLTSGDVQVSQARMDDALDAYHRAGSILSRGERNRTLSRLWRDLGDRFLDAGQTDASVQAYRQALDGVGVTDRTSELRAQLRRLAAGEHRQVRQPDPNAVTAE